MAHACTKLGCGVEFAAGAELIKHRREVHQESATLTYLDGYKETIRRNEQGDFVCCCGREERNPNTLLVHAKTHLPQPHSDTEEDLDSENESTTSSEDETGEGPEEQLPDPNFDPEPLDMAALQLDEATLRGLRYLNLEIIPRLRALACLDCGYCINHRKIHSHRIRGHERKVNKSEIEALERQIRHLPLTPHKDLPQWIPYLRRTGPGPPIPQLKLVSAFQCDKCGRFRTTVYSIKHHGKACRGAPYTKCHVQAVIAGIGSAYFKVLVSEPPEPEDEVERALKRQLERLRGSMEQLDMVFMEETTVPPWIERTGWLGYADIQVMADLSKLTHKPKTNNYKFKILDAIFTRTKQLLFDYLNFIDVTDRVTLRNLRSPNAELSLRPLARRKNKNTHPKYFAYMARLICFVVRLTWDQDDEAATGAVIPPTIRELAANLTKWAVDSDLSDQFDTGLGDLMAALLAEPLYLRRKFGNLTINFLALMGYCPSNHSFKNPERYTPLLAGLMFCFRLVGLRSCWRATEHDGSLTEEGETYIFHANADEVCATLKSSCRNAAGEILALLSVGRFHNRNHAAPGQVQWNMDDACESLNFVGERFSIPRFILLVKHILSGLEVELNHLLFCTDRSQWPQLPEKMYDAPNNAATDWSFVKDPRNSTTVKELSQYVLTSVMRDPGKRGKLFINMDVMLEDAADAYITRVERYLQLIGLAIQFTCGQPIRNTELLEFRLRNTDHHQRNIYLIENRTVMVTTAYSKTQENTGRIKNICRFPTPFLGDQIIYYITTVLPFYWYVVSQSQSLQKTPFLFASPQACRWKTGSLAELMEDEAFSIMQFELTPRKYRQIAIAIAKKYVEPLSLLIEKQRREPDVNVYAHQAGHSDVVRMFSYGVDADDVVGLSSALVAESRLASVYWQVFVGAMEQLPDWVVYPSQLSSKLSKAYADAVFRSTQTLLESRSATSFMPGDTPLLPAPPSVMVLVNECAMQEDTETLDTQVTSELQFEDNMVVRANDRMLLRRRRPRNRKYCQCGDPNHRKGGCPSRRGGRTERI